MLVGLMGRSHQGAVKLTRLSPGLRFPRMPLPTMVPTALAGDLQPALPEVLHERLATSGQHSISPIATMGLGWTGQS